MAPFRESFLVIAGLALTVHDARAASPPPAEAARAMVEELVACGTRHSLSSWTDPKRGIGCGRDAIVKRLEAIAKTSGGALHVVVDRYEATAPRTRDVPGPMENVSAVLEGTDPVLRKTAFAVSGHYDSMPSEIMEAAR